MKSSALSGVLVLFAAAGAVLVAALATTVPHTGHGIAPPSACVVPAEVDARVDYYAEQVAARPRLYPKLAQLGKAYLDRTRWSGDARDLAAAREALQRSIDIQPTLDAWKVLAATANYSHRFEDALPWCDLAAGAAPEDLEILAMRTEALLALDRPDDVARLLSELETPEQTFYGNVCSGKFAAARGDRAQALHNYDLAGRLADTLGARELSVWTRVTSAALFLDTAEPADAEPYLRAAAAIDPDDYDLQIHLAEFEEGTGRDAQALSRYEHLLSRRCDAEVHRRAYLLARRLRQDRKAAEHYDAAERLWRRALDLGEAYPLEGLAKLYCEAGRNLNEAVRLAERNLEFKRDASARETLRRAQTAASSR